MDTGKNAETKQNKRLPIPVLALIDAFAAMAVLVIFAFFHHVLPSLPKPAVQRPVISVELPVPTESPAPVEGEPAAAPEVTDEPVPTEEPIPEPFSPVLIQNDTQYKSENISVEISEHSFGEGSDAVHYFIADIYVKDVHSLRSHFSNGNAESASYSDAVDIISMDAETNAIVAVNGDNACYQRGTCMLRNGVLYRTLTTSADICVLRNDGSMETFRAAELKSEEAVSAALEDAWQCWTFGPALLDENGEVYPELNKYTPVGYLNPRTAIGYYEPGHYCLVTVDGRQEGYSRGMWASELAELFVSLGCVRAYNLDGGGSTRMTFNDAIINSPTERRNLRDIILVAEISENGGTQ